MAKRKKVSKKLNNKAIKGNFYSLFENKIKRIRSLAKPLSARAVKYITLFVCLIFFALTIYSNFYLVDQFETAKIRLAKNPKDFEAHLILTEEFLKNNDLDRAEKELLSAQTYQTPSTALNSLSKLSNLWKEWREANPNEISKTIEQWEKIISEVPTYRDGYLHLTYYYLKLGNQEKAQENLKKAIKLEPNHKRTREIEQLISKVQSETLFPQ